MNTILRTIGLFLLVVFSPGILAAADSATPSAPTDAEYTITVIPFYGPEKIWKLYTPFIDFLKETTGKPWTLKLFPSHEALLDAFCGNQVGMALLGPAPLGKAMAKCNAEPLAVALSKEGNPFYHSMIVANDPEVTSLTGLRGKRVGLFKGSTAAHILPRQLLRQAGLNKSDFMPVFFEGQDHIINALLKREVVAAGLKETLFNKFKDQGFRILATSNPLPNFAFAAAPGTSDATRKLFTDTLLHLTPATNEVDRTRLSSWDDEIKNGFIAPTDTFRSSVQDIFSVTTEIMSEDR